MNVLLPVTVQPVGLPIICILIIAVAVFAAVICLRLQKILSELKNITDNAKMVMQGEGESNSFQAYSNIKEIKNLNTVMKEMFEGLADGSDANIRNTLMEIEQEKMQAMTIAQARFYSNISHEVRTPMNSILGIIQILLNDENLTETQVKYIAEIKDASDILIAVFKDIFDLSQLETGELSLFDADFNFQNMLNSLAATARFNSLKKRLEFKYTESGNIPKALNGDESRMHQMLYNFLGYAIKYSDKGTISLDVKAENDIVTYKIEASKLYIPPENLEKLFTPFDTSLNMDTGMFRDVLALAISKKIADILGAKISIMSEIPTGTSVVLACPLVYGDETNLLDNIDRAEFSAQKAAILIVDDNEINLHVASGLIETLFKADCDLAASGKSALERVKTKDYDLIFMDHMMPEMNGIETTVAIRRLGGKFVSIPIVALTANAVIGTKDLLIKGGMNDFLSKPIQAEELHSILAKWLPPNKIIFSDMLEKDMDEKNVNDFNNSSFISSLSNIKGFDLGQALRNVAHREDILKNSLKLLAEKIPSQIEELKIHLDRKNFKSISLLTHTLKGSFSNCGFMVLAKLASKLSKESEVDNFAYCRENLPFFMEKMSDVEAELFSVLSVKEAVGDRPIGTLDDLENTRDKLIDALEDYNYNQIVAIVDEIKRFDFGENKNILIEKLSEKVSTFDYNGMKEAVYAL